MNTRSIIIALATSLFVANGALALTETVDGITWTYTVSNGKASVGGMDEFGYYINAVHDSTTGAITIPSVLGGYPVTGIFAYAFSNCGGLTSVSIPNSVTRIDYDAFYGCRGLTSVTIPGHISLPSVFRFVYPSITNAIVENGSTSIRDGAFSDCSGLLSVTIPDSVTSIGDKAFYNCSGLMTVTIPDSVTSIGDYAFYNCASITITNMSLPSVTSIGDYAFYNCASITNVSLPAVASIGDYAFSNSSDSTSTSSCVISFSSGVYHAGDTINIGWSSDIAFSRENPHIQRSSLKDIFMPCVTNIGAGAFAKCSSLSSVVVPPCVTSIGNGAFSGCSSLEKATVPQCVMTNCLYNQFEGVPLRDIKLDATVLEISEDAFAGCKPIAKLEVDAANEHFFVSPIDGCLYDINMTTLLCCPKDTTRIVIPEGVIKIGNYAFAYCTTLGSVTMPATLKTIGKYAFFDCINLQSVVIPNSVTNIEKSAFEKCSGLASATISDTVIRIGDYAFGSCRELKGVTIPASVQSLSPYAFSDCDALWTEWYQALSRLAVNGNGVSSGTSAGATPEIVSITVTNVIVHYVTQSVPSDAVTPPTTAGIVNVVTEVDAGAPVAISPAWAEQYPDFEAKFGSDFSAAIVAETGKRDGAGNAMRVWQDFVAGTDPTDPDSVFTASITFDAETGLPVISWSPELSPEEAAKRTYRKYGKVKLTDENWTEIDGDEASYNFFKVSVEMK